MKNKHSKRKFSFNSPQRIYSPLKAKLSFAFSACWRALSLSLPSHDQRVSYQYAIGATLTLSAHLYSFRSLAIALVPAHLRLCTTLRLVRKRASVCVLACGGCLCFIRRAETSTSNSVLASDTCALNGSRWFCPDILRPFIRWSSLARKKNSKNYNKSATTFGSALLLQMIFVHITSNETFVLFG